MATLQNLRLDYCLCMFSSDEVDEKVPVFSDNRVNYILVYSGSFNPPHIGHLNFMRESLAHAGHDLHIVGALFDPRSDDWLRSHKNSDLILPHTTRSRMLLEDKRVSTGVWRSPERDGIAKFKLLAQNYGVRVRFLRLLSAETDTGLDDRSGKWSKDFDGILLNTYGRHSSGTFSIPSLSKDPWNTLHEPGDAVYRYQRMVTNDRGTILGFLRVITRGPDEKTSLISSSGVKSLAKVIDAKEMECSNLLREIVLGWSTLEVDETWAKWRAVQMHNRNAPEFREAKGTLEKSMKDAWELEKRNCHDE
jgi:glycerol-3-phosphate cytidylyltransferase-like family protein